MATSGSPKRGTCPAVPCPTCSLMADNLLSSSRFSLSTFCLSSYSSSSCTSICFSWGTARATPSGRQEGARTSLSCVPTYRGCQVTPPARCLRNQRHEARRTLARAAEGPVGPARPAKLACGRVGAGCCVTVPGWQLPAPGWGIGTHPGPAWTEGPQLSPTFFWHDCRISSTSSSRLSTSLAWVCRSLSISISSRSLACKWGGCGQNKGTWGPPTPLPGCHSP